MSASAIPILDSLWRASEMGRPANVTTPSGHPGLDAELPGGGWPAGQLSEVLQAQAGLHEWRLLLPAVRAAAAHGAVVLIGCPHWPNMAALAGHGIPLARMLVVEAERPAERLWAAEQALRCRDLAALLVWLPQARAEQLRRLQFTGQAAHQPRAPLAFVFRPLSAQQDASPAPLRLSLRLDGRPAQAGQGALPGLEIEIFKRRGPQQAAPLRLQTALPPVLALWAASQARPAVPSTTADERAGRIDNVVPLPTPAPSPPSPPSPLSPPAPLPHAASHVVDRIRPVAASA
ncbi:hypothetical protein RD110_15035 [Rhodoferax koreense]|uniref:Translesion DNA synthesis-associated protein ImuA n=1 Tax=Rhodoferax koreensis TaxID=1842727 RepID=A0A1P8JX67_9BURK|nr:translesion DNA synthesis-associated protein ImuA [Rhodoferax koreense]APW38343.1 hypothetical protein RD110_15035 [Rhodoferax koreense]